MQAIIIRHAHAGEADPKRHPDDDLRPITKEGQEKQRAAAQAMRERGITIDHLVTSPLVRAVQTAEIVADVYGFKQPAEVDDALGHRCSPAALVKLLSRFPSDAKVALVGHEPCLSKVAAAMVGGGQRFELKKSGVIGIGFEGAPKLGEGTLLYHLAPSEKKGLKTA